MKLNLQYFAESNGAQQPSGAAKTQSSAVNQPSGQSSASSSSAKTYTQSDVDRMLSEAANDTKTKLSSGYADKIEQAKAEQKKLDNMNATELKAHIKKEHQQKLDAILAENKKYKHDATVRKALNATEDALSKAKIPNSNALAKLVMDIDPKARTTKVQTIVKYLKSFEDQVKSDALKGKNEPQSGAVNIPSDKDVKKLNPFAQALIYQNRKGK